MSQQSPWRSPDFRLLLAGQTTSQFGAQISGVAIPLLAVLTLHATAFQLGLVSAAGTIAFAAIGLPAGAWLDSRRRRPVLITADVARALLLLSIPICALTHTLTITQLIIVSLLTGIARVFFDVGYQSYLPSVIGRDTVLAGNSAMETARAGGQIVGPGLGGWLVTVVGAANLVLLQAVTFVVSALALTRIRTREAAAPGARTRVREGLTFVLRTPLIRATAIASAAGNFSFGIGSAVSVLFAVRTIGLSPTAFGVVLAVGSVTVMLGAALTPRMAKAFGSARVVWLVPAATGPLALLGACATPGWGVLLLVFGTAAGEFGQIVYAITNVSLRQRLCPDHLLSRVGATMRFLMMSLFPLGALLGGVLGGLTGPRATLVVAFTIIALSPLPIALVLRGMRDVEELSPFVPGSPRP